MTLIIYPVNFSLRLNFANSGSLGTRMSHSLALAHLLVLAPSMKWMIDDPLYAEEKEFSDVSHKIFSMLEVRNSVLSNQLKILTTIVCQSDKAAEFKAVMDSDEPFSILPIPPPGPTFLSDTADPLYAGDKEGLDALHKVLGLLEPSLVWNSIPAYQPILCYLRATR